MNTQEIKASIKEKYDKEVAQYDTIFENRAGLHFIKKKLKKAKSYNFIRKGQNVLEIGSATGVFSFEYEKLGVNLTSIDISTENISWATNLAKERGSAINFKVADVEDLPFPDNYFDGILSFSTLRYVPDINKAIQEIYRVLKPGGYFIIDFPNKKCPWFGGLKKKVLGREHIFDNHYLYDEVKGMISKVNFTQVVLKKGLFIPKSTPNMLFWLFKLFEFIAEKMPVIRNYSAIIFVGGIKQ
jgi:ubiquinone/menaquinone biosynthesis C-methylase UbiE